MILNPHLALSIKDFGVEETFSSPAADSEWRKWRPNDPTSSHWYDLERFERLVLCQVSVLGLGRELFAGGIVADRSAIKAFVRGANNDHHAMHPPF